LSNKLTEPQFDIDPSGNVRKSEEAESLHICSINIVFNILNSHI